MTKKKTKEEEKKETLQSSFEKLSLKTRVVIAIALCTMLFIFYFLFIREVVEVTKPVELTEREYISLLSTLDNIEWKVRKGDEERLGYPTRVRTEKKDSALSLIVSTTKREVTYHFSYRDKAIKGFINSTLYTLSYSSSSNERNKALSLYSRDDKIVLYEKN